ncbi:MAG: rRNA pseudouridine synthase [Rhodoferax sp.]
MGLSRAQSAAMDSNPRANTPGAAAPERLSKLVMRLRACSRREAEALIEAGAVRVCGAVQRAPMARARPDQVVVDASAQAPTPSRHTVLWHKPLGVDAQAFDVLTAQQARQWLAPERGPVEANAGLWRGLVLCTPLSARGSGLVVLSQEPGVQQHLQRSAAHLEHEWRLDLAGSVDPDLMQALRQAAPSGLDWRISPNSQNAQRTRWRLVAHAATLPDAVCAFCAAHKIEVLSLQRNRIGRLMLSIPEQGNWALRPFYARF